MNGVNHLIVCVGAGQFLGPASIGTISGTPHHPHPIPPKRAEWLVFVILQAAERNEALGGLPIGMPDTVPKRLEEGKGRKGTIGSFFGTPECKDRKSCVTCSADESNAP
jgi:hypothetical protein